MTDKGVLMAILVIASIGGTFMVVQGFGLVNHNPQTPLATGGAMLTGNVKIIQYDEAGHIIAYRQTDNHIVKDGLEVLMGQLFRGMNTTSLYTNATVGKGHPIQYMQIGTGGQYRLLHNNTDIFLPIAGCLRQTSAITNSSASHKYPTACVEPGCNAQMNVTAIASFAGGVCTALSIDEAAIYDNSTSTTSGATNAGYVGNGGGHIFARNIFGSVDLGPLDTLQLQWEFTFTDS